MAAKIVSSFLFNVKNEKTLQIFTPKKKKNTYKIKKLKKEMKIIFQNYIKENKIKKKIYAFTWV